MNSINQFYIDESGSSGDLANDKNNLSFGNQPIFSLCAIGLSKKLDVDKEINKLKIKHKIQLKELKSHKLFKRNKYEFAADLINYLLDNNTPLFIEVVDKKYFICAAIVNTIILPPNSLPKETKESNLIRKYLANLLYSLDNKQLYDTYLNCCSTPSEQALIKCFDTYINFFTELHLITGIQEHRITADNIIESKDDYLQLSRREENAYKKFIPLPDKSKKDKDVWLLPNLSSYCSIYARINQFKLGRLSNVTIVHDEQNQFDEILLNNHLTNLSSTSELSFDNIVVGSGNYSFTEDAKLLFDKDESHIGLQIADVIAGFIERYYRKVYLTKDDKFSDLVHSTCQRLHQSNCQMKHTGVNPVVPGF